MENGIREMCHNLSKSRSILNDKYELKKYLKEMSVEEAKQVLRMRLHMVDLPCNYGGGGKCWLCDRTQDVNTEHYFECKGTEVIRKHLNTKRGHITSNERHYLLNASKFLQMVEKKNVKIRVDK